VSHYSVDNQNTKVVVHADVNGTATAQGRPTASYIVAGERPIPVTTYGLTTDGPQCEVAGDGEGWNW